MSEKAPGVDRHLGLLCYCLLLDCCHNEGLMECGQRRNNHGHSGSEASRFLYPWGPGEEPSWLDMDPITMLRGAGARNIRL